MPSHRIRPAALAAALLAAAAPASAWAGPQAAAWSASWAASPQPLWDGSFVLPTGLPFQFKDQTVRQALRLSVGGSRIRVVLGNDYGSRPLRIGAAQVARAGQGSAVDPATGRALRFGGQAGVTIPPGARVVSDPVDLPLPALARLAVSLHLPQPTAPAAFHWDARETVYVADGDLTAAAVLPAQAAVLTARVFVSGVLVEGPRAMPAVVALGDSITDGNGSTPGADRRWPDALAERLAPHGIAVVNAGISGNRLLAGGMGDAALARLERDVLAQPGAKVLVVLLGTNDIGWPGGPFAPDEPPMTAQRLIAGLRLLAGRAHANGLLVVAATIPPFEGALRGTPLEGHHSPAKEAVRQAVNRWMREGGAFDAVSDVDRVLADPAHPARLAPAFDSGDHLHPGDAGYRALAQALAAELLALPLR